MPAAYCLSPVTSEKAGMIPKIDYSVGDAHASTDGNDLTITTGQIRRVWRWMSGGFATREVAIEHTPLTWTTSSFECDWQLPDATEPADARLESLVAGSSTDDSFTGQHLSVVATIAYPDAGTILQWTVWAYPGGPGIRTHLQARRMGESVPVRSLGGMPIDARVDQVPWGRQASRRRYFGYYNETQQRNDTHQDLLKEEVADSPIRYREWCAWASAACLEHDGGGIALVKESHKCVNQRGVAGGEFVVDPSQGLICTGWGLKLADIGTEGFAPGWATWTIAWTGSDIDREIAFKRFDRLRYPIDPARDIYIQANTWGSSDSGSDARRAAAEPSVMKEIEVCADLGIDILQIDDGWQTPLGAAGWQPGDRGWTPHPECYPEGWKNISELASKLNIKLGLWAAAEPISLDELKSAFAEGGFCQYKLDFANLQTRPAIDALMTKVRDFVRWTGHRVRINWDVTENPPRYGYFFAREYGPIYLENRKPAHPRSAVYRPHTVLRDLWQASKYLNLHRIQGSIQNIDRVDRDFSDAHLHSHQYATAIALMSIPLFFTETKYYSDQAREQIRSLLAIYKAHRTDIYRGIVHPIGDKPDNHSWCGFQCHLETENRGYMTVFRELCNSDAKRSIRLARVSGKAIQLTDLLTGQSWEVPVSEDGSIALEIAQTPQFLFLQYAGTFNCPG
jgi:hypothetical protein